MYANNFLFTSQTFNSCTGVCEGPKQIKLGADSVSELLLFKVPVLVILLCLFQLNRVGIGTSTPSTFTGGSGQTINMSGKIRIGGLDLTPNSG